MSALELLTAPGLASRCDKRWSVYQTRRTGEAICSHLAAEELELMAQRLLWYHGEPGLNYGSMCDVVGPFFLLPLRVCLGKVALGALLKFI